MAKTVITGTVLKVFERKRQNALYEHQFVRVQEKGTTNQFDIQFYNSKIDLIESRGVKEGVSADFEVMINGKYWENENGSGIFLKINGQNITVCS